MSRTLIEIFLTVRYMATTETEARAKKFADFFAKAHEGWMKIIQKYYPAQAIPDSKEHRQYLQVASTFPLPNEWTGIRGQMRAMAFEPDAYESDANGQPINCGFDYEALYKWTSYFVHATVSSLESHVVEPGDVFRVHARPEIDKERGDDALFNVVAYLHKTFVYAFRATKEDSPEGILTELHDLLKSYVA